MARNTETAGPFAEKASRPRKSPAEKAQADVEKAQRAHDKAVDRLDKINEKVDAAEREVDETARYLDFVKRNPALPPAPADEVASDDAEAV